jgi:hypothetical protein
LVCREKNFLKSDAFAELTRNTACPRPAKNTAIGSHAGPVGSMITSSRVPSPAPANAAASTATRLSTVGTHFRFATVSPVSSSTRTVWALAIPRSIPTSRLSLIVTSPLRCRAGRSAGSDIDICGHGPKEDTPNQRLPLMCCNRD